MQEDADKYHVIRGILLAGIWFGLLTGLIEGMALFILKRNELLDGPIRFLGLSVETLWVSPLFDLLLFFGLALLFSLLSLLLKRLPILRLSILVFATLMFLDWLTILLSGRLSIFAVAILSLGLGVQTARWYGGHEIVATRIWRRTVPILGVLAILAIIVVEGGGRFREKSAISNLPAAEPDSPNILVVVVDTLRADHLSAYGYQRNTSPNIDRLAQEGVLFEKAYSTSSWTLPAHASLLTGLDTSEHGADVWRTLSDQFPTIGEELQKKGYRTGGFSANVQVFNRAMGFGKGFQHFEDVFQSPDNTFVNTLYGRLFEFYVLHKALGMEYRIGRMLAPQINDALLNWIDRDDEKPFFAILNYFDVHSPYIPPQPYRSMYSTSAEPGGLINTDWGMDQIYIGLSPEQLQEEVDAYDGAINYADNEFNQLFTDLENAGLTENTLVVILSDHGESFGEHELLEHHNSLYPEVIQVPIIFWWPGHIPAGMRISTATSITSLPATILDLIEPNEEPALPGLSLAQLWQVPGLYSDWPFPIATSEQVSWVPPQHLPYHGDMSSVINLDYQYIDHSEFGEELYDLTTDPHEEVNLAQKSGMESTLEEMKAPLADTP